MSYLWVDTYASVADLRAFAREHAVLLPPRADKYAIVETIRAAGLEPPRAEMTLRP
jgi:hypothetical protein